MPPSRLSKFSFAAGVLTTIAVSLAPLWFIERRLGLAHIWDDVSPFKSRSVDLPPAALWAELTALGAVPDNMPAFTDLESHQTFLVRPDPELEYVLKPNVRGVGYVLRTKLNLNLDPPVVYVPDGQGMSAELTAYLTQATRVRYTFSTSAEGRRATVPVVAASRRVLIVGDSVAFGLGVDDDATMASQLQRAAGDSFQVFNAAVAGYNADQIYLAAKRSLAAQPVDALIYVASTNDFDGNSESELLQSATSLFARLASLRSLAGNRVVVMLTGYLEYAVRDVIDGKKHGWYGAWIHTDYLRRELPAIARQFVFDFIDVNGLVDATVQDDGSIFSPFAMFVDHVHLSRRGHGIAAAALRESLSKSGL